jgi:tetratricopeptide (TPR) repeat protein
MLETIREFGLERLAATGESATAWRAHAAYVFGLTERAWPAFRHRAGQEIWLNRLEAERGNLRAALTWLDESGDSASLLRLAGGLSWFWYIRGPLGEGRAWLERALGDQTANPPDAARARAMVGAGLLAHYQGDDDQAQQWLEASLALSSDGDDPWLRAFALLLLGMVAEDRGDYHRAAERFAEGLDRFRLADDRSNAALALTHLGVAAWGRGDVDGAVPFFEEAQALQRAAKDDWGLSISLGYLGLLATLRGQFRCAAASHRESLALRWHAAVWEDVAASFSDLAALAAAVEQPQQAARLFGAAAALREETGRLALLPERAVFEHAEASARGALGPQAFAAAEAAGRALPRSQAFTEATAFADEIAGIGAASCESATSHRS